MKNLIKIDDFKNPFKVSVQGEGGETFLNQIIAEYQKPILTEILGEIEYNAFETDLNDTVTPTLDQWTWFLNGTTYTHSSVSYVYPGIKPILTKFIYYRWQKNNVSDLGESGALKRTLINAVQVVPTHKIVGAYNKAVDEIKNIRQYSPTVYKFFDHMQQDNSYFPDWEYTDHYKINIYNL